MKKLRLAILDLYDNTPNQGMRCIKDIIKRFETSFDCEVFDVRGKAAVPDLGFDVYISTGGPGNPLEGDGVWDVQYYEWLESVWTWNQCGLEPKKHVFFICHSFQMACNHFGVGQVTARQSMSFGTFPVHLTDTGISEPLFDGLPNPFFVADFRSWQVVQPDMGRLEEMGAEILCLEKVRPHVPLERAIMAIRFSEEIIGTQFHPEADPDGMLDHFLQPTLRKKVVEEHGEEKYLNMIAHLNDPEKINLTHETVLPMFLGRALYKLHEQRELVEV